MPTLSFTKMHGAGNDYVYLDLFRQAAPERPADLARVVADRHKGIGGDGLILIGPSDRAAARMRMFNADGSEAEMCGNGIRCVAKYLYDHGIVTTRTIPIETGAGVLSVDVVVNETEVDQVRVNMGVPRLQGSQIPCLLPGDSLIDVPLVVEGREFRVTCVSMGNPHCVIFVESATDDLVGNWGPKIENHAMFPARTNVEFVEVLGPSEVRQRTWERGSGETLACGTGASAVCVAGVLSGRTERRLLNHLTGGDLVLEWPQNDGPVFKTGPATEVFSGVWRGVW